jgi:group I intron endonuclease
MKFLQKDNIGLLNKSGIYQIRNIENNKLYIGSAKNFRIRYNDHKRKLKRNNHPNRYLQNVFNASPDKLLFSILEITNISNALSIEQKYIDLFYDNQQNCYNLCPKAGSALGRKHSIETKKKISSGNFGKIRSLETKIKLSVLAKQNRILMPLFFKPGKDNPMYGKTGNLHHNYGKKHSKESIEKMRNAKIGKIYPATKVAKININNNEIIEIFNSVKDAVDNTGICNSGIRFVCSGKRKTAGGFSWKYIRD